MKFVVKKAGADYLTVIVDPIKPPPGTPAHESALQTITERNEQYLIHNGLSQFDAWIVAGGIKYLLVEAAAVGCDLIGNFHVSKVK